MKARLDTMGEPSLPGSLLERLNAMQLPGPPPAAPQLPPPGQLSPGQLAPGQLTPPGQLPLAAAPFPSGRGSVGGAPLASLGGVGIAAAALQSTNRRRARRLVVGAASLVLVGGGAAYAAGGNQQSIAAGAPGRRRLHGAARHDQRVGAVERPGRDCGDDRLRSVTRSRPRAVLVVGLGGFLMTMILLSSIAPAASAHVDADGPPGLAPAPPLPPEQLAAIHRLVLACRAGTDLAYAGVQQVRVASASGDRESVVEVAHQPNVGVHLVVRPTPTTRGGTYVGQLNGPSLLPTLDEATLARISSRYAVHGPRAGEPVAGRQTDVVELVRTSGTATGSVAARFWLDRSTSLPLRREVFDGAGRVQQASTFTSISYRPPPTIPRLATEVGTPPDLGQGVTTAQLDGLRHGGWLAPGGLPDDFDLVDARVHGTGTARTGTPPRVLQLTYTDGISVVSLFEQVGRLDADPMASWTARRQGDGTVYLDPGTPERVVWSADGHVYTLVSDDPGVVDAAMGALPQPTSPPGLFERLGKGLRRVLSWLNPFG